MPITDNSWTCDIKAKGCLFAAVVSWICKVEGIQISGCRKCYEDWRARAAHSPELAMRCPRCERQAPKRAAATEAAPSRKVAHTPPLGGIIAEALDSAMFREGILIDTRLRVMRRLAAEDPWLNSQQAGQQAGQPALRPAERTETQVRA
jgi:hypothetical protein